MGIKKGNIVSENNKKKQESLKKKLKEVIKDNVIKKKNILVSIILLIIDIVLIIYVAKDNVSHYVNVNGRDIFIGKTKNLLLGRNYITLVVSVFIYLYGLLINKVMLGNKISIKKLVLIFIGILIFNMIVFYIFTNRVY